MEAQKTRIDELEQAIIRAKAAYTEAMLNLSKISEDVCSLKLFLNSIRFLYICAFLIIIS